MAWRYYTILWSLSFDDFETVSFIWFCPPTDQIRPINVKCHWRGLSHSFSTEPSLVWQNINFIKSEKRGKKCSPKIYMFVKKGQSQKPQFPETNRNKWIHFVKKLIFCFTISYSNEEYWNRSCYSIKDSEKLFSRLDFPAIDVSFHKCCDC